MARVFISHARDDLALASDVHRWLDEVGHEVVLDSDPRDAGAMGGQWRSRLRERLRWADAVVCVVTSASVASNWCTAEIAIAQTRGSLLLPLRGEPGLNHPLLADVKYAELTQGPAAACAALDEALRRNDATGGAGWPEGRSPFPGLRPFEGHQHRVFFGRAEEIKVLAERVRSASERTALLVVGPSGCGKSSLVRAGLLPTTAHEPGWRTLPPILPGTDPVSVLARGLATAAQQTQLGWTAEHVERRLDTGGLIPLADDLLLADPDGPQRRLLLVVDQFEELLTQTPAGQRARFVELLRPALTGPVRVVGTLRPEFLDQLLADPDLAALPTDTFPLLPLHREALRLVIKEPAQLAGIEVDDDLVAQLVEDTHSGEALPLLAFTLAQLTAGIRRGGQLSAADYEERGGVAGALTRQADEALAYAVDEGGRSREQVISGLLRLVTVDEQGRPTRRRVRRDELPAPVVTELDAFVVRRLLTTDTDNGTVVIGVAHEAFLSAWPPLDAAITANAAALRARRAVEHAATEWDSHGRPSAQLWTDSQLNAAITDTGAHIRPDNASLPRRQGPARWLLQRHRVLVTDRVDLTPTARDFLHTSIRHDNSRRRRATTILSVLLLVAVAAASVAVVEQRRAQQRQRTATVGQLVNQAEATRSTDLRAALLLGLAAHQLHPTSETHSSLVNALASGPYLGTLTGHKGSVDAMAFTPDGHTLATGSDDTTVILWDFTEPGQPHRLGSPLAGHSKMVSSVAFAPDGRTLATGSGDTTVILWDVTDRAQPRQLGPPLTGHSNWVNSVAFAPDGRTLATGSDDTTVILWDLTNQAQPRQLGPPLTGHTGPITSLVLTPDSHTLITGSTDYTAILWDLTDRAQPRRLGSPLALTPLVLPDLPSFSIKTPVSLALAPDGRTLASRDGSSDAILWDLTDRALPRQLGSPLRSHTEQPINVMAFAPGGRMLATSGSTGTVLWDLTDPSQPYPLRAPLTGHSSTVNVVAFAPDGHTLVVGSDDGTAILWDLTDSAQPQRLGSLLTGQNSPVKVVAFAPDGRTLATSSADETVMLWDVTDPARPRRLSALLTGQSSRVRVRLSATFAPDGRTLATSSVDGTADGTVILWDVTDRTQPRQLGPLVTGHNSGVFSVAFAPDGRTLATGDGTVILWDVTDRTQPRRLNTPLTDDIGIGMSMAFTPDGRTLATGSFDGNVILWDVSDRTHPRRLGLPLTGHTLGALAVEFAPDGRTLATVGGFNTILWNVTDREQPHRLGPPLTSNVSVMSSVTFAPDGRTLATGGYHTILWDVADRAQPRRLGPPLPNNNPKVPGVQSVAFSPDGRTLATGNDDMTATLWDLTALNQVRDHAVERACSITHGGLSRDEWDHYIPGLPYQDTCPG